jgi:DNA-binding MarR family transcriptional regulator
MEKSIPLSRIENTVFYAIDKAIKSYRQFAQRNIKRSKIDITIDQWLTLKTIHDNPDMTQREIADKVFKDYASVTRMIELLVKRGYLKRSFHEEDRRRFTLVLTEKGYHIHAILTPIVHHNRTVALEGLTIEDVAKLHELLEKITHNCLTHNP